MNELTITATWNDPDRGEERETLSSDNVAGAIADAQDYARRGASATVTGPDGRVLFST